jgi:REP element-mobilizing transposase RayT
MISRGELQAGAYFVTVCTRDREPLFGEIVDGAMRLNEYGQVVHREWIRSAEIRDEIDLDAFVVMPNHLHGIVVIQDGGTTFRSAGVGAHGRAPLRESPSQRHPESPHRPPRSLGSLIAGFKSAAAKRINAMRGTPGMPVWQRNLPREITNDGVTP